MYQQQNGFLSGNNGRSPNPEQRELDKTGSAERKGMDSGKNAEGIMAMCRDADCTGRTIKKILARVWKLQDPDTVRASAPMRLNRRVPNGTQGGVSGRLLNEWVASYFI